jgi:hypothetical protein
MNKKDKFESVATLTLLLGLLIPSFVLWWGEHPRTGALGFAVCLGVVLRNIIRMLSNMVWLGALLALLTPDLPAQVAPVPGYDYAFTGGMELSMPVHPEQPNVIIGAICVGGVVLVAGWIGIKIISACLKVKEMQVTNNAGCGQCPLESPTSPEPVPTGLGPPVSCACDAPPAEGQPLPLEIQHSYDGREWSTVASGIGIGSYFILPEEGYWRAVPMPLSITGKVLHAPPGVLEYSADLSTWEAVAVHTQPTDLDAQPGFYRVRLN